MKNLSKLVESLQQTTESLQSDTDKKLQETFSEHEKFIEGNLSKQQNVIESYTAKLLADVKKSQDNYKSELEKNTTQMISEIQRIQQLRAQQIQRRWTNTTVFMMALSVGFLVLLLILTYMSNSKYNEMKDWKRSAEIYKKESNKIETARCTMEDANQSTRLCVRIDPKYRNQHWGENRDLMIISEK